MPPKNRNKKPQQTFGSPTIAKQKTASLSQKQNISPALLNNESILTRNPNIGVVRKSFSETEWTSINNFSLKSDYVGDIESHAQNPSPNITQQLQQRYINERGTTVSDRLVETPSPTPRGNSGLTLAPRTKQDLQNLVNSQIQEMQDYQRSLCATVNVNVSPRTQTQTTTTATVNGQPSRSSPYTTSGGNHYELTQQQQHTALINNALSLSSSGHQQDILRSIATIECVSLPEEMSELTTLPEKDSNAGGSGLINTLRDGGRDGFTSGQIPVGAVSKFRHEVGTVLEEMSDNELAAYLDEVMRITHKRGIAGNLNNSSISGVNATTANNNSYQDLHMQQQQSQSSTTESVGVVYHNPRMRSKSTGSDYHPSLTTAAGNNTSNTTPAITSTNNKQSVSLLKNQNSSNSNNNTTVKKSGTNLSSGSNAKPSKQNNMSPFFTNNTNINTGNNSAGVVLSPNNHRKKKDVSLEMWQKMTALVGGSSNGTSSTHSVTTATVNTNTSVNTSNHSTHVLPTSSYSSSNFGTDNELTDGDDPELMFTASQMAHNISGTTAGGLSSSSSSQYYRQFTPPLFDGSGNTSPPIINSTAPSMTMSGTGAGGYSRYNRPSTPSILPLSTSTTTGNNYATTAISNPHMKTPSPSSSSHNVLHNTCASPNMLNGRHHPNDKMFGHRLTPNGSVSGNASVGTTTNSILHTLSPTTVMTANMTLDTASTSTIRCKSNSSTSGPTSGAANSGKVQASGTSVMGSMNMNKQHSSTNTITNNNLSTQLDDDLKNSLSPINIAHTNSLFLNAFHPPPENTVTSDLQSQSTPTHHNITTMNFVRPSCTKKVPETFFNDVISVHSNNSGHLKYLLDTGTGNVGNSADQHRPVYYNNPAATTTSTNQTLYTTASNNSHSQLLSSNSSVGSSHSTGTGSGSASGSVLSLTRGPRSAFALAGSSNSNNHTANNNTISVGTRKM